MQFDPNNNVVKLCAKGMEEEAQGNIAEARRLFDEAWNIAANDFEAFTAAHYVARNQPDLKDSLYWHLEALNRARLVQSDDMEGTFPSLYLNVANSYEKLGNMVEAAEYYRRAAESCEHLPKSSYADMIRGGVAEGLRRTGAGLYSNPAIEQLIATWCERKELKPLSILLPAYVGNLGTEADRNKLISAFSLLVATRSLLPGEQKTAEEIIKKLADPEE